MSDRFGSISIQSPKTPSKKDTSLGEKSPHRRPQEKQPKNQRNFSLLFWLALFLTFFTGYLGIGFLAIPFYITDILPSTFNEKTGYTLEPTTVKFNPLTFKLHTGPVKILADDDTPLITLQALKTDIAPIPLLRMDLVCNSVEVEALDILLVRNQNSSYNLENLFGQDKGQNGSEIMNFSDLPFFFSLNNIAINNSRVVFSDLPAGKKHHIEKIQLKLPTVSNIKFQADKYIRPHFSAIINGSPFQLTGTTSVGYSNTDSPPTELACDIKNLDLKTYSAYLPFDLPFEIDKGTANGTIELFFNPGETEGKKLAINFDLNLSDTILHSGDNSISSSLPAAQIFGTFKPALNLLNIQNIIAQQPLIISKGPSFFKNLSTLKSKKTVKPYESTLKINPFSFLLSSMVVSDGHIEFSTPEQKDDAETRWSNLEVQIKGFRNSAYAKKYPQTPTGTFEINAEKHDSDATFSYIGKLESTEIISGDIQLVKANADQVFKLLLPEKIIVSQGTAELKGILQLQKAESSKQITTFYQDATLSINNFSLLDKNKPFLSAKKAQIGPVNTSGNVINLGKITFANAETTLQHGGEIPVVAKMFSSGKYLLQSFVYQGSIIGSTGKDQQTLSFTDITLSTTPSETTEPFEKDFQFEAISSSGGSMSGKGHAILSPFSLRAELQLTNLNAGNSLYTFSDSPFFQQVEGKLSGKGSVTFPNKTFAGDIEIKNGQFSADKNNELSWNSCYLKGIHYGLSPAILTINSVRFNKPEINWQLPKLAQSPLITFSRLLQNHLQVDDAKDSKINAKSVPLVIKNFSTTDGAMHLIDHRLNPEWRAHFTKLEGKISDIKTTNQDDKKQKPGSILTFTGLIDGIDFQVLGNIDFSSYSGNSSVQLEINDYPLASFHKQLTPATNLNTPEGSLTLQSSSNFNNSSVNTSGHVKLSNIYPHSMDSSSALPLALLAGQDNSIDLNFEFSATSEAAKNSLFNEALAHFQRTLLKGTVSPLLLTSQDYTELIDEDIIEFKPGEFVPTDRGRELLLKYSSLLAQHPYVGLQLTDGTNSAVDRDALFAKLKKLERQRVETENEKRFYEWQTLKKQFETTVTEKQKAAKISDVIVETDIPSKVLSGFIPVKPEPITISDAMILDLAIKRINVIQQYLRPVLSLQYERILAEIPEKITQKQKESSTGVMIALRAVDR